MRLGLLFLVMVVSISATPTRAEAAFEKYTALFAENRSYLPDGVRVLGVRTDGDSLTLNLSKEILNYGGSANEKELIRILLDAALDLPGFNYFTLLIEGFNKPLTEGTEVLMIPIRPREAFLNPYSS